MDACIELIREAEVKWIPKVCSFVADHFSKVHLPSHDLSHHQRVWQYARELLQQLSAMQPVDRSLVENSLIASFFHDLGLTKTTHKEHGCYSRLICEEFFSINNNLRYPRLIEALNVIEQHDDKAYASAMLAKGKLPLDLLTIIHMADDLDAFGAIGIFRYAEIYLLREVSLAQMPGLVITNLNSRFKHLEHAFQLLPLLSGKHTPRYQTTWKFYNDFMQFDMKSGPARIVKLFREYILENKMNLRQFIALAPSLFMDAYGQEYMDALSAELNQYEEYN
jgi:HD superfamily phosphodiesterase